jgi:hypothetical protein
MHLVNDKRCWKVWGTRMWPIVRAASRAADCAAIVTARDHRGTVLSRAAVERTFSVEGTQLRVSAGRPVSCNLCQSLQKNFEN